MEKIRQWYYKTVPMGFETRSLSFTHTLAQIIRQSLWDLKRRKGNDNKYFSQIIRQSLWDLKPILAPVTSAKSSDYKTVPMGFETDKIA